MTPSARLQAVFDLLEDIRTTPRPADGIVNAYLRARRYIGSKDRVAVATLFYEILRHHARLGWWLQKNDAEDTPRARGLAFLVLVERKTPRSIVDMFSGGKYAPAPLDESETALLAALKSHTVDHPSMPDEVRLECPPWAADSLRKKFGDRFAEELGALLEPAPLDIRVNTLKTTRDEILAELDKASIEGEACPLSPWGIRIRHRPALTALPMLKDGRIEIQDEGSQLIALLTDARPGQRVIDFCAGAGGKTLAMAARMNNKGRIIAADVLTKRLARSTERFRRAGVHNIETKAFASERDPWIKRHKGEFDRVLVDAPCSGVGTWRRNPDSRWRSAGPGLEKLAALQAEILASAARLVKPGGYLVYATCSLLPEENEEQVERFLAAHPQFRLLPCMKIFADSLGDQEASIGRHRMGDCLFLTPARHGTDGFFGAVLELTN